MLKHSLTALALGTALVFPGQITSAVAQQSTASELDRVSSHLRAVKSMTANFIQTDRSGQAVSGKLTLKQPGRIRFQYQDDVNMLIVSDGSALTMIDYDVRQVQRWPIKESPLGALLNPKRDLTRYGKVVPTGDPNVLSVDIKDPKRPEYGTINLIFVRQESAPAGLRLAGWVALDSQNKRTSIRLSGQRYNVAVSDKSFDWDDPRPNRRGPRR